MTGSQRAELLSCPSGQLPATQRTMRRQQGGAGAHRAHTLPLGGSPGLVSFLLGGAGKSGVGVQGNVPKGQSPPTQRAHAHTCTQTQACTHHPRSHTALSPCKQGHTYYMHILTHRTELHIPCTHVRTCKPCSVAVTFTAFSHVFFSCACSKYSTTPSIHFHNIGFSRKVSSTTFLLSQHEVASIALFKLIYQKFVLPDLAFFLISY